MFSEAPDFNAWFPEIDGFPRPDWKAIREFIRTHADADHLEAAWQEIARTWLDKTCEKLGGSYTMTESENFQLISELDERHKKELLTFLERTQIGRAHV